MRDDLIPRESDFAAMFTAFEAEWMGAPAIHSWQERVSFDLPEETLAELERLRPELSDSYTLTDRSDLVRAALLYLLAEWKNRALPTNLQ